MATVAIGDIHGHVAPLDDLLAKVVPTLETGDTLVFLGDYVDRGPDSKGVLDRLTLLRAAPPEGVEVVFLLGNHEEWLLNTLNDPKRHSWFVGMDGETTVASYSQDVAALLKAEVQDKGIRLMTEKLAMPYERFFELMPPGHLDLLRSLVPYVRTPDVVCSHGGVDPGGGPAEAQTAKALTWGTNQFPADYIGDDPIVYGHKRNAVVDADGWPGPCVLPNRTYGLDTIFHGVLTAMRFPGAEVIQSERFPA